MWQQAIQALQNIALALSSILQVLTALPTSPPSFQFAALPSAVGQDGKIVYCSNGRKPGEGAGLGTGMLAFASGGSWFGTDGTALAV